MRDTELLLAIRPRLELIDAELSDSEVELTRRPFHATVCLIRNFVVGIDCAGKEVAPPASVSELLEEPWAASIYALVHRWYKNRYGEALRPEGNVLRGFVVLYGTPFPLHVPPVQARPEEPGETSWLVFLNDVKFDEDPRDWIQGAPDLTAVPHNQLTKVREVAGRLRSINTKLLGISNTDAKAWGLVRGIPVHLRSAAELALRTWREGGTDRAYWELQMACECAFKVLLQLKTGTFRKTHDLFILYEDAVKHGSTVARDLLKLLPRWDNAASLRYGQGQKPSLAAYYSGYRATLQIVDSVITPAVTLNLSGASIKLRADPWAKAIWDNPATAVG